MSAGFYEYFFWSEENFQSIQNVLGVELSDEIKIELQQAHRYFAINQTIDISRLSKTRARLERISKALDDYEDLDALTEQVLILALPRTKCPSIQDVNRDLRKLHERAVIALKGMPAKDKPGPNEKVWPLRTLIATLRDTYEKSTGKKATLVKAKESSIKGKASKVKHNTPQGQFFEFVSEFLRIVKHQPHSDTALMRQIEKVLYPRKSL